MESPQKGSCRMGDSLGIIQGTTIVLIKGDSRSLGYGSQWFEDFVTQARVRNTSLNMGLVSEEWCIKHPKPSTLTPNYE